MSDNLTFDDAIQIARGCHDYGGGYRANPSELEIFRHGIQTVVNALDGAKASGLTDMQSQVLHRVGSAQKCLIDALTPFANYACDEPHVNETKCQNCIARDAIHAATILD